MKHKIDPAGRPDMPWRVPSPDELEFVEMFRIKAGTGIDVLDPLTRGHAIAACLWFASREWDNPLEWAECQRASLDDLILGDELDEELDPEQSEDPTRGNETPSKESSLP